MQLAPLLFCLCSVCSAPGGEWGRDFELQPVEKRPALEVRYTDASRADFDVVAADYHVRGELRTPHRLVQAATGALWLALEVDTADGATWSTLLNPGASRINLYRRRSPGSRSPGNSLVIESKKVLYRIS